MMNTRKVQISSLLLTAALLPVLSGCTTESADLIGAPPPKQHIGSASVDSMGQVFQKKFELSTSEITAEQGRYDQNAVSVLFKAQKGEDGINGLTPNDLLVKENGTQLTRYAIETAETERKNQIVDIMFLVDVTGTMTSFIETAKLRLKEFIRTSRAQGYHTRMCISSFGDYTNKKCDRFFDNNPSDKSTEKQVEELLNELARLKALKGLGKDPGYPDLDENPLQALVDASKAPWAPDAQRFVILVTDWGFLYAPDNMGEGIKDPVKFPNTKAPPTFAETLSAIKSANMSVFTVTRTQHSHNNERLIWDGYNTSFKGQPSIVEASGGEYFNFDEVVNGKIKLDHILERILLRVLTTYKMTYVVEENPGLDPTTPVEGRSVNIAVKKVPDAQVKVISVSSSQPKGRPNYQKSWDLSTELIQPDSVKAFVNGKELGRDQFSVQAKSVVFNKVPDPGSKLRFSFMYQRVEKNLRLEPIALTGGVDESSAIVTFNGAKARPGVDYEFASDLSGQKTLTVNAEALTEQDPYKVFDNKGLQITVEATTSLR